MGAFHVHLLPRLVEPAALAGGVCVVVDVLRATTTMSHALAAGARDVLPCLEIADALAAAETLPRGERLLGGERGGAKIEGFDFGNSPGEYTPDVVAGKTVIFTTTNGTRAILHCREAARVVLGAFVNLSSLARELAPMLNSADGNVHVICAGTGGEVSYEDTLFAGALADRLLPLANETNDPARLAAAAWRGAFADFARFRTPAEMPAEIKELDQRSLAALLRDGRGGRNCLRLGLDADIDTTACIDSLEVVPEYHAATGRIVGPRK
jgi:2-phosphosulfolactate phosphatase